jgi:undecaprenyl-diphosphatase
MRTLALMAINRPDYALMRRFNNWEAPRWVQTWMMAATRFGDGYLWMLITVLVLLSGSAVRYRAAAAAWLASAASILVFQNIKKHVGRKRPCEIQPHRWAQLLPPDQFSFPSGHTMTAFAFTFAMQPFFPNAWLLLLAFAVNIGVSRVLLGMHFLSDILAGGLLGYLIGHYTGTWLAT